MKLSQYLKHRWYMFVIVFIAGIFSYLTAWASDLILNKDFLYIVAGVGISFLTLLAVDYTKTNSRIKTMNEYIDNNCAMEFKGNYPLDKKYASKFKEIVKDHNKYKEMTETEHSSELEFITKWVHDVKVPIAAINLITGKMDNEDAEQIEMQLNYIDQNIQKILFHMKSKTFYDDYKIRKVSIKSIVNQALKNYAVFFSYKSINLSIDCDDYMVFTDDKWSSYIFSQFISNAIKYTDVNGKIVISAKQENGEIVLSIKNTGGGIAEKHINNIFKRGYSGYGTRKEKSTGYGLYLSKKLADKMEHRLSAKSIENLYAEFSIHYKTDTEQVHYNNVRLD